MQANVKKARRLKKIDDRDDDPSDTFNPMVSKDPILMMILMTLSELSLK